MIEFRQLPDDHPDLVYSPLLRAARLTLSYVAEEGPIKLTKTKAFKRTFVHWAAEHFDWPGRSYEDLFRYHKVLNEYDFQPLELLHFLLISLKLGRHYKGEFRLTNKGRELSQSAGALYRELISFYVLDVDHASYGRFDARPFGAWDTWLNVINIEAENGASERALYGVFYGEGPDWDNGGWREMAAFSHYVLMPLEWSGLISVHDTKDAGRTVRMCFKTPLWRSALKLDTDNMLERAPLH
ncbi:hypothetical protein [Pseudogemmobacter sp. W21_MBD1_M6]|uniref:hypothetical protein n=1 Tax=Pseudogemmobacter sp. W21_MBD1_M6 TaxID=3240271 RepID=UPI003F9E7872